MNGTAQATANEELLYEVRDGIGYLTLNRPEARNALTFGMYQGVAQTCANVPDDRSVRAIVMTGAGDKAFAAGTDIAQFRDFTTPKHALDYEETMEGVMSAIEQCKVPTIAAINGACTGGGAAIAAACDLRLCSDSLKFGFPIARTLGNCLSASNLQRLVSLVGMGRTRELLMTARLVESGEARSIGFVSEVLPSQDALLERATELAAQMATYAPLTLRATKETLRRLRTPSRNSSTRAT
jgi:enoyl-CoA hydratase